MRSSNRQLLLFNALNKKDFLKRSFYITAEKLSLFLLIIFILFIFSYTWGFRRGFQRAKLYFSWEENSLSKSKIEEEKIVKEKGEEEQRVSEIDHEDKESKTLKEEDTLPSENLERTYKLFTIQLATYRNKDIASFYLDYLRTKGFEPFILKKGKFLVLYAGKYSDKNNAKKDIRELKSIFKDCFIKRF